MPSNKPATKLATIQKNHRKKIPEKPGKPLNSHQPHCQLPDFQVTLLRFPRVFGWLRKVVHKNETSAGLEASMLTIQILPPPPQPPNPPTKVALTSFWAVKKKWLSGI